MGIIINEIRLQSGDKSLKAFCDVEINGITVRDLRIIKEPNKRAWVASPQASWRDKTTGSIKYKTLITFPDEMKGELDRLILNSYHREMEKANGKGSD